MSSACARSPEPRPRTTSASTGAAITAGSTRRSFRCPPGSSRSPTSTTPSRTIARTTPPCRPSGCSRSSRPTRAPPRLREHRRSSRPAGRRRGRRLRARGLVPYSGGGGGRMSNLLWEHRPLPPDGPAPSLNPHRGRICVRRRDRQPRCSHAASLTRDRRRARRRAAVRVRLGVQPTGRRGHLVALQGRRGESGTEYVSFGLAMPTGPDLLLSVFGLQLQIALNGLASTSEEEVGCFMELMAAVRAA